jgi:hypothetical protein
VTNITSLINPASPKEKQKETEQEKLPAATNDVPKKTA